MSFCVMTRCGRSAACPSINDSASSAPPSAHSQRSRRIAPRRGGVAAWVSVGAGADELGEGAAAEARLGRCERLYSGARFMTHCLRWLKGSTAGRLVHDRRMRWIDTHCHLDAAEFAADRDAVL